MNKLISHMILLFTTLLLSFTLSSPSFPTVQDLLRSNGLPVGLLPKEVDYFTLQEDGRLEVFLEAPCYANFESRVHFSAVVKANLSYGSLVGLEGLKQQELFLWLPVKDIVVENPNSGVIIFDIGVAFKQLSLSLFEEPPKCNPDQDVLKKTMRSNRGFEIL
ncbi:hypothetical protein V5N11_027099 [Cardamine amara subsp. amara]|uniref:Transmembrane protein n=1 Tax=Cardamine amara subsp. amara TaxID=228776 RepID=A0ABD1AJ97_CARAN